MSSTGRQQIYYQGRHHQNQQRLGIPIAPHLDSGPGRDHQIVVVSGSSSCTGCVADYHVPCECPSCESKELLTMDPGAMGSHDQIYPYAMEHQLDDDDDGIVHEFTTDSGERHVVIMTKTDEQEGISAQERQDWLGRSELDAVDFRIRRQKLSDAARNRYALLSEEEKRAVTERRLIMRQRRKQKEREMEELEAILRASNDITDDLVPMDVAVIQRKRAKSSRYQTMNMDERREYNQQRRLRQLGLPENINELEPDKLETIKRHIADVNARKAEAARQRYHRMSHEERKAYNRRRTESFRKRRVEEEKLLSTPAGQITPEALEKAQSIMIRNAKRAEQARLRYQKKQQEKGIMPRRQRKPKIEYRSTSGEPNLDRILDTIERDVVRKTVEARQALIRMRQTEPKKEEEDEVHQQAFSSTDATISPVVQAPLGLNVTQPGHNIVQYVQVPAQNGVILSESKFIPAAVSEPQSSHASYTMGQKGHKFERSGGATSSSYYPVSLIQPEWSNQRSGSHHHQVQVQQAGRPARIEIVQPAIISMAPGNFDQTQQYTIHLDQQQLAHRSLASSRNINALLSPVDEKVLLQKAKRAERARRRYHEMSAEARHEFNAKRAHSLKMARLRDEELCRLGDELSVKGEEPDQNLRLAIDQARMRRAKRAEAARIKYQKMSSEQRKAHNALRDAQRRQRKRELEDTVVNQ